MNIDTRDKDVPASGLGAMLVDGVYFRALEHLGALRPLTRGIGQAATFAFASRWRRNLLFNAGLALGPQATRLDRLRCAYAMVGASQRFIGEVLSSHEASVESLRARVRRFEGTAEFLAARKLGRGVVVAGIHMGAFEPALAVLRGLERRVHVLYQPDAMPRFERARRALRTRLGVVEHRVSDGLGAWAALCQALEDDEAVVVHADRTLPGQHGVRMPFLGLSDAELPPGPVRLATTVGSPIVPTYCARTREGLFVWADGWIETRSERVAAPEVATHPAQLALVASMERAIRRFPQQWMAFHDLRGERA